MTFLEKIIGGLMVLSFANGIGADILTKEKGHPSYTTAGYYVSGMVASIGIATSLIRKKANNEYR